LIAIVTFPGSNGDHDMLTAVRDDLGAPARLVDYRQTEADDWDGVILPGGFSYGDHLRCGAIARFAPAMGAVTAFAERGGPVLGVCNGFQILCEAGLLPGALLRNRTLRFHCFWTHVRIESSGTPWTRGCEEGEVLRLPVAHGEGAYYADERTLAELSAEGRIVARYAGPHGNISQEFNPNGSIQSIAGVASRAGNVVGLMPHPERAANEIIGGGDGRRLLSAALELVACPA